MQFYHYTDATEAAIIQQTSTIVPAPWQTCKWYTPNRYDNGADAQ